MLTKAMLEYTDSITWDLTKINLSMVIWYYARSI